MRIRFDNGPDGGIADFAEPILIIEANTLDEVPPALERLSEADGWLAGYCSYELGYAFEPRLRDKLPEKRRVPLLRFGVYDAPNSGSFSGEGHLENLTPIWSEADYAEAFAVLHEYIGAGDIYQANLTFPIAAQARGTAEGIYNSLFASQPVGYGALVEQADYPDFLCRSPELFFDLSGNAIETKPMKGTIPRSSDPIEDEANRAFLAADTKNRAENLMIVDLLRNDLSRVSEVGSVKVPDLFAVESYTTVHQMVSRIQGELLPEMGIPDVLAALYPCGSITGAPKLRAMEIIRELEPQPRDIYCGSIGWISPEGRANFNVAIRTIMLEGETARLNVGGGVVWDSTAAEEYEEALWKARYATLPLKGAA